MYSDTINKKKYLRQIQLKREEMISLGSSLGLTNEKTIACSQELDELLNEYHNLFQRKTLKKRKSIVIREMSFILYKSKRPIKLKEKDRDFQEIYQVM